MVWTKLSLVKIKGLIIGTTNQALSVRKALFKLDIASDERICHLFIDFRNEKNSTCIFNNYEYGLFDFSFYCTQTGIFPMLIVPMCFQT